MSSNFFLFRVAERLRDIQLARTASSLSFTSLLAMVPLAAVTLAFVARFPIFAGGLDALEAFLLKHFLPLSAASLVHAHVLGFAEQAARLTGISIVFVMITAGFAMAMVEREINAIWGIQRGRPLARRVVVYAITLTVAPVLFGASISITTWLIVHSLAAVEVQRSFGAQVMGMLPLVFSTTGLTMLYKLVPAKQVGLVPALVAGVCAALAFEAAKLGFAWYMRNVPTVEIVYGALAAVPVFLLWIYLCWMIVLSGAAISATLAEPGGRRPRVQRAS